MAATTTNGATVRNLILLVGVFAAMLILPPLLEMEPRELEK